MHNINLPILGNSSILKPISEDQVKILDQLFFKNGEFIYHSAHLLKEIKQEILAVWCHMRGIYGLPTLELIEFLKKEIGNAKTIEIGAGSGILGKGLGIIQTDSRQQENWKIKKIYENMKQPIINYPDYVRKFEAQEAIRRFQPDIVIGSWITEKYIKGKEKGNPWGVDEERLLKKVKKYIMIGHQKIHNDKNIFKYPHRIIEADWIMSRSMYREGNRIYIWEGLETA